MKKEIEEKIIENSWEIKRLTLSQLKKLHKVNKNGHWEFWSGWYDKEKKHYHYHIKDGRNKILYDCGCDLPYKDKITPFR